MKIIITAASRLRGVLRETKIHTNHKMTCTTLQWDLRRYKYQKTKHTTTHKADTWSMIVVDIISDFWFRESAEEGNGKHKKDTHVLQSRRCAMSTDEK